MFVGHKDLVWGLIASMYLGNVVGLVLVLTTVPVFASILRVPFAAVAPMIVVSCARDYFKRHPKDRYGTEVESWADIQSYNIEFVTKRL